MYDLTVGRTAILGGVQHLLPLTDLIYRCRGAVMRICSIAGCGRKCLARGYCSMHYQRLKISGDPLFTRCGRDLELHGMKKTVEYKSWTGLNGRCYNKNNKCYYLYGGRGITVCDRWRQSFTAFLEDMGLKPFPRAEMDRIDNDGNYTPDNCRWINHTGNMRNSSIVKLTKQKADEIREIYKKHKTSYTKLASIYGVCFTTIGRVIQNKLWK